jgi:hypothetical protein
MKEVGRTDLLRAFHLAFDGDAGAIVLDDLSRFCLETRQTYCEGDAYHTAFNEGARSVMIHIRAILNTDASVEQKTTTVTEKPQGEQ